MRLLIALVVVTGLVRPSDACIPFDSTSVWSSPAPWVQERYEPHLSVVPARPSLFLHVGAESKPGLAELTLLDGTVIPYVQTPLAGSMWNLLRIDVPIESGVIVVRYADASIPRDVFVIDPHMRPATRKLKPSREERSGWIAVESNAALFRLEADHEAPELIQNYGSVHLHHSIRRIVAMYADRTEELIYERLPARHYPWRLLVVPMLALLALFTRRLPRPAASVA